MVGITCRNANNVKTKLDYSLVDFISYNLFFQINTVKNCYYKTLDLILSNFPGGLVTECKNPISLVDIYHPPLEVFVKNTVPSSLQNKNMVRRNFRKADYMLINNKLKAIDWLNELTYLSDVNAMVEIL